jgi:hypothetical protein
MSGMNPGFASYLAAKKKSRLAGTPAVSGATQPAPTTPANPMAVLPPQMVARIKKAPTGVLPPGLAKYMASHKKKSKK